MTTESGKTLTPQQLEAAKSLAQGATRAEAAHTCGCNDRTIYKWFKKTQFKEAVSELQQSYWDAVMSGLRTQAVGAGRYLAQVVSGRQDGNGHRVKAAATLLNCALRLTQWIEVEELKQRLEQLERGAREPGKPE